MNLLALFKETLLHKFMENWPKNIALDQSDSQIRSSVKNLFFLLLLLISATSVYMRSSCLKRHAQCL